MKREASRRVLAAGITRIGGRVTVLELDEPRALAEDEVLIEVAAAGVGNWDEIVRTGGWDVGASPPMALGVEAAGVVLAAGSSVGVSVGDGVLTHPLPLRHQGTWAERLIAAAGTIAAKPAGVSWEAAGAFPVPALTAEQVLTEALSPSRATTLLVHGAGGVTGGLIVQLAALRGVDVIATAGAPSQARLRRLGAREVLERSDPGWPQRVRGLTGGRGVAAVVNAVRGGSSTAVAALADEGQLVTITSDPPPPERGIEVSSFYVRPDAQQLAGLAQLLAERKLSLSVAAVFGLHDAERALAQVAAGSVRGAAAVIRPRPSSP